MSTGAASQRARASNSQWHSTKNHHKTMQCPSCGFKFEPKRRQRVTLVVDNSARDAVGLSVG